jgi:hypothetical protein
MLSGKTFELVIKSLETGQSERIHVKYVAEGGGISPDNSSDQKE